jgi:pilus assembly protein FimV
MFKKSALAIALLGTLGTGSAVALGLGDIELKSALNQPLKAEIELLSATRAELDQLKVKVASPEAFAAAGVERPLFLNKLQFDVKTSPDGKSVVAISSRDVVREPFLDFLLEVSWSKGKLLREYTVLVDPPVTMPAAAPVQQAPRAAKPNVARASDPGRVSHTAQMPPVASAPREYRVQRNDTLWRVAQQVRPDSGVSIEQTMLGLQRVNPQAFTDNNINNLKAGYILRVPDREELLSLSQSDAVRETARQYSEWNQAREAAASQQAAGGGASGTEPAEDAAAKPHLELVAADMPAKDGEGGAGAASVKSLQNELLIANEALEAQRRESEEMSARVSLLEEQIQNMQRLIQLKDEDLARLQAQVTEQGGQPLLAGVENASDAAPGVESEAAGATTVEALESADNESSPAADSEDTGATQAENEADTASDDPFATPVGLEEAPLASSMNDTEVGISSESLQEPVQDAATSQTQVATEDGVSNQSVASSEAAASDPASFSGIVDRIVENRLWLGVGAVVLALIALFGLRRKREPDSEFEESILKAAREKSSAASDSDFTVDEPTPARSSSGNSSLLSEFALSDMGTLKNDGEADPLAEADVYLAYGRYQQAEDLVKDALDGDPEQPELDLKLLEIYLAARNQAAFDAHARLVLDRIEDKDDPMWQKIAEMGSEISPDNPLYGGEGALPATDAEDGERTDFADTSLEWGMESDSLGAETERTTQQPAMDEVPQFDMARASDVERLEDLQAYGNEFEPDNSEFKADSIEFESASSEFQPDSSEFEPDSSEFQPDSKEFAGLEVEEEPEVYEEILSADMDSIEPDKIEVEQDNTLAFDLEGLGLAEDEDSELPGDGELTDMDEVSTKLDLARAYLDMGDPDGARSILDEVIEEGSEDQRSEAEQILAKIA